MNRTTAAKKIQTAFRTSRKPKSNITKLPISVQTLIANRLSPRNRGSLLTSLRTPSQLENEYKKRQKSANAKWGKLYRTIKKTPIVRPVRQLNKNMLKTIENLHKLKKFVQANGGRLPNGLTTNKVNNYIRAATRVSRFPRNFLIKAGQNINVENPPGNARKVMNALGVNEIPSLNITMIRENGESPASFWFWMVKANKNLNVKNWNNNLELPVASFKNSRGRTMKVRSYGAY